jgi:hypothetical protein
MPLFILKRVISKLHCPCKDQNLEEKLARIDRLMAYLGFSISLNLDRLSVAVKDGKRQLYSFHSPDHMQLSLYKNDRDCGFDVLGFKF